MNTIQAPTPARQLRRHLACGLVAAAAGLLTANATAQPFPTPPPPAAPRPVAIATPSEARLANGLRVVVARREGVPLVTASLVALSGAENDPPQLAGLASMSAALLTQGTRHRSAPQIAAAAEALGGSLDSGAGWNESTVSITVTTPRLGAALGLVAEVATEPVFAPEELDRLRTQTLDSLKVAYASPGVLAGIVAERLAYGSSAYGHPAGGTPQSLPRIVRGDLVALHQQIFRPDNAVLILAGDIDAATGLALARTHFGAWKAPAAALAPTVAATAAAMSASAPTAAIVDMAKSGQAAVVVALAMPPRSSQETAVAAVLNGVLGGGYSSRLGHEIRIKRGLSYGASSGMSPRRDAALLRIVVQTKNESAAEVLRLVQAELDGLVAAPVGADELAARKATLIGNLSRSLETTRGLAGAVQSLVVTGRSPAELDSRIATLGAVDAREIQAYASAHLGSAGRRVVVVAGEASVFGAELRAAQPGIVTIPAAGIDLELQGTAKGR
ncbi:MAG: pitrilysin family protein [Caldimonas sp.]